MSRQTTMQDLGLGRPRTSYPLSITAARNRIKRILSPNSSPDIWRRDESNSSPQPSSKARDFEEFAAAEHRVGTPISDAGMDFVKDMKWWSNTRTPVVNQRLTRFGSVRQRQHRRSRELATPAGVRVCVCVCVCVCKCSDKNISEPNVNLS